MSEEQKFPWAPVVAVVSVVGLAAWYFTRKPPAQASVSKPVVPSTLKSPKPLSNELYDVFQEYDPKTGIMYSDLSFDSGDGSSGWESALSENFSLLNQGKLPSKETLDYWCAGLAGLTRAPAGRAILRWMSKEGKHSKFALLYTNADCKVPPVLLDVSSAKEEIQS